MSQQKLQQYCIISLDESDFFKAYPFHLAGSEEGLPDPWVLNIGQASIVSVC